MNTLHSTIDEIPELAPPISVVNLIKFAKQAYYNGNPNYFALPTSQENSLIDPSISKSNNDNKLIRGTC